MAFPTFCRACGYNLPLPNPKCNVCKNLPITGLPGPGFRQYYSLEASALYPFTGIRLVQTPAIPLAVRPLSNETVEKPMRKKEEEEQPKPIPRRSTKNILRPPLQRRSDGCIWCPDCDIIFYNIAASSRHIRGPCHEDRYVCPLPGCGRSFADNTNLKGHLDTHLTYEERSSKFQECRWCEKSFYNGLNRRRHEQIHYNASKQMNQ